MRRATRLLPLVATLGAACVSAPPAGAPETPIPLPDRYAAAADLPPGPPVSDSWWSEFGDPALTALVEEALNANHDLVAAAARVRRAEAAARIAGAELSPALAADLDGSRRKQNFVGFPIPGSEDRVLSTTSSNFGVRLNLSWEVDLWGRIGAQAREGVAELQATRADLAAVRNSIAGQVARAWFAAREAAAQVELAERTVASFERSAEQVRDRFEQGVRSPLDVRLSLAQLAGARAGLQAAALQRDGVIRQLEVLAARYPAGALETRGTATLPATIPAGVPATLIARRPDLVAAERRLAAAGERWMVARASLYPRLALTASGGTSSDDLTDLVDGDLSVWSLVANLTAPLFQGGRLRAGVDLAQAGIDEGAALWIGTALRAYAEVESALAAEGWLARQREALEEAVRQSREAERQALERYRTGLIEYVTVLEAQRRTFDAERQLLSVQRLHLDTRVDLYLALGGGFTADEALPLAVPAAESAEPNESTPMLQEDPR